MESNAYADLAKALDLLPGGFPRTGSGVEIKILQRIFSPEEALMAGKLNRNPAGVKEIAARAGVSESEAENRLKSLAGRGLIWVSHKEGELCFRLTPYVVGIYEAQDDYIDHELAHLFEEYWMEGGARGIMDHDPALMRVLPAQQSLKPETILPYDDVKKLLENAKSFEVIDCICRKQMDLVGKRKCHTPVHVCFIYSSRPRVKSPNSLTYEEALKFLDKTEEMGLVHTVSNMKKGTYFVCNCCGCCCSVLRGITQLGIENSVAKANYYAVVDPTACIACGTCEERCQVDACRLEEIAEIDLRKCIGCGLCVTGCSSSAISLKRKPEAEIVAPPEDYKAWEDLRLKKRGLS